MVRPGLVVLILVAPARVEQADRAPMAVGEQAVHQVPQISMEMAIPVQPRRLMAVGVVGALVDFILQLVLIMVQAAQAAQAIRVFSK